MAITKESEEYDAGLDRTRKGWAKFHEYMEGTHEKILALTGAISRSRLRQLQALYIVWRELCSLVWRIGIARKNNWFRYGISLDLPSQRRTVPATVRRKYRHVRILGIQRLYAIHPAASPSDLYMILHAIDPQSLPGVPDRATESPENISCSRYRDRDRDGARG